MADPGERPARPHPLFLDQLRPEGAKDRPHPPPLSSESTTEQLAKSDMITRREEARRKKTSHLARSFSQTNRTGELAPAFYLLQDKKQQ